MTVFLDLPNEILTLIMEGVPLYPNFKYLLVCKRFYNVALPIFVASSTPNEDLRLSADGVEKFPLPHGMLYDKLRQTIQRLSIRLVGHPSNETSNFWLGESVENESVGDLVENNDKAELNYHPGSGTSEENRADDVGEHHIVEDIPPAYSEQHKQRVLTPWRDTINKRLSESFDQLRSFTSLTEIMFEALSENNPTLGNSTQWDYLFSSTLSKFILSIPPSVVKLTLDLGGSDHIGHDQKERQHLCPMIASRLGDFECVRLRMRCICPLALGLPVDWQSHALSLDEVDLIQGLSTLVAQNLVLFESKLKSLVLKLSLPSIYSNDSYGYDSRMCDRPDCGPQLSMPMIIAGCAYAEASPSVQKLKVSYRDAGLNGEGTELFGFDCVGGRKFWLPEEHFCYEDEGSDWDDWEDLEEDLSFRRVPPQSFARALKSQAEKFHAAA